MPSFPQIVGADLASLVSYLDQLCAAAGRTGADLYAGNCASCHGPTAGGGLSGLGVDGPDIRCTESGDYQEKVSEGDDDMPAFPLLGPADVTRIVGFVQGTYCQDD
jgi:mono/diheme cytochrome c family protein